MYGTNRPSCLINDTRWTGHFLQSKFSDPVEAASRIRTGERPGKDRGKTGKDRGKTGERPGKDGERPGKDRGKTGKDRGKTGERPGNGKLAGKDRENQQIYIPRTFPGFCFSQCMHHIHVHISMRLNQLMFYFDYRLAGWFGLTFGLSEIMLRV